MDEKNKGFLFMDFNSEKDFVYFVDLNDTNSCKIVLTTENNSDTIVKIEFEFEYIESKKKELIQFYTLENEPINQVCLYKDHQLAKKWIKIIQNCISS